MQIHIFMQILYSLCRYFTMYVDTLQFLQILHSLCRYFAVYVDASQCMQMLYNFLQILHSLCRYFTIYVDTSQSGLFSISSRIIKTAGQLVESLRYKPVGRGFHSRLCHWKFSFTQSFRPRYGLGVDSASNRNEYQEYFPVGKGCRCVGLTNLPP